MALPIFYSMAHMGLRRDGITYCSTISALAKGNQAAKAVEVRTRMCTQSSCMTRSGLVVRGSGAECRTITLMSYDPEAARMLPAGHRYY